MFCTCEMVENGCFGGCFRRPFHQSPTHALGCFNRIICTRKWRSWRAVFGARAQPACLAALPLFTLLALKRPRLLSLHFRHVFDIHSHSPFPLPSAPRAQFPKWTSLGLPPLVMAGGIYGTVFPTGLHPCLPRHPPSLNSGFYFLVSQTSASSHGRTTITTLPCLSPSTLDRSCVSP